MTYSERLNWFCRWADHYGLQIIKPKYKPNDNDRGWAKMNFAADFKKYHANRSAYPNIKADSIAQEWSVYIYNKPKKYFKRLDEAKSWHDANKGN